MKQADDRDRGRDRDRQRERDNEIEENLLAPLEVICKKKNKKMKKEIFTAITDFFAYALKILPNSRPAMASIVRTNVLLRAKAPRGLEYEQVVKNPHLLQHDHALNNNLVIALLKDVISTFKQRGKNDIAKALESAMYGIAVNLIEDSLIITPKASKATWTSIINADPSLLTIASRYKTERKLLPQTATNISANITRTTGVCYEYNILGRCSKGADCKYGHYCFGQHDGREGHPFKTCQFNPIKSKMRFTNNNFRGNYNYNYGYNQRGGFIPRGAHNQRGNRGRGARGNRARFRGAYNNQ